MALIVAARFDTFEHASVASQRLFAEGFTEGDIHTFYINSAGAHDDFPIGGDHMADADSKGGLIGALIGAAALGLLFALLAGLIAVGVSAPFFIVIAAAGVGAYLGALAGALWIVGKGKDRSGTNKPLTGEHPTVRPAGVMLALHVTREKDAVARSILRDAGGQDIERARGRWVEGKWEDFDPREAPEHVEVPSGKQ